MIRQISPGERNIRWHYAGIVAQAVVPAGQLQDVGVELLYALYELAYANPLGLLEHVLLGNTVRRWNITQLLND